MKSLHSFTSCFPKNQNDFSFKYTLQKIRSLFLEQFLKLLADRDILRSKFCLWNWNAVHRRLTGDCRRRTLSIKGTDTNEQISLTTNQSQNTTSFVVVLSIINYLWINAKRQNIARNKWSYFHPNHHHNSTAMIHISVPYWQLTYFGIENE